MDYDAVAALFLTPSEIELQLPDVPESRARRLRDSLEPIATIGWWSREVSIAITQLGHDFFDGYVWGRAASLGADVAPPAVVSAFGVFEPSMLSAVYSHGRSISSRDAVLDARASGATAGLAAATVSVDEDEIGWLGDRLLAALADLDGSGRPLFSGLRSVAMPESAHGRAWRAAELVREHRGDGHIAACVSAGLDPVEMNVLTEVWLGYPVGEYSATRAFSTDRIDSAVVSLQARGLIDETRRLTDGGSMTRNEIEAMTDRSQDALIGALGTDFDEVARVAGVVSESILDAHAAPADPRKRAAG